MPRQLKPKQSELRVTARALSSLYRNANDTMRNIDGLQPHEAFDELLKYVFARQHACPEAMGIGLFSTGGTPDLRAMFVAALASQTSLRAKSWGSEGIRLSARALDAIHSVLAGVDFNAVDFDVHAAALRDFLGPEVRRGLGIYLTPDEVVRAAVDALDPPRGSSVYDPCCGSGTFLSVVLNRPGFVGGSNS